MQKLIWQNSKGEEINLTSGHYGITNWQGFSEVSSNVQSQTVPFQDGSVYLDALLDERELSVTLAIQDNNDLELRYQLRRELIHALNPKLGEGYLIYTNDFISKRIKCIANPPVFKNHNSNDTGTPKASLTWTACEPYWEDLEETVVNLTNNEIKSVVNNGDIQCQCKIEILGGSTEPQIINMKNRKSINLEGKSDYSFVINTEMGKKSIVSKAIDKFERYFGGEFRDITVWKGNTMLAGLYSFLTNIYGETKVFIPQEEYNTGFYCTIYAKNKYILCGEGGSIYVSKDFIEWNYYNIGSGVIEKIKLLNDKLFAIKPYNYSIIISEDGETWNNINTSIPITDVLFKDNKYYVLSGAYASGNFKIYTTNDFLTFTEFCTLPQFPQITSFTFGNGIFVVTSLNVVMSSSDNGVNWNYIVDADKYRLTSSEFYKNKFYIAGENGYYHISSDGLTWEEYRYGEKTLKCKLSDNKIFLISLAGGVVQIDAEGEIENFIYHNSLDNINHLFFHNNTLVLIGAGLLVNQNINSNDWELIEDNTVYNFGIYGKGLFVIVGNNGLIKTSSNAINWTQQTSGTSENLYSIVYSEDKDLFVIVGNNGTILTSPDAINWTQQTSGTSASIGRIIYEKGFFVINGGYKSIDAVVWEKINNVKGTVAYANNLFAFRDGAIILISEDLLNWNEIYNNPNGVLRGTGDMFFLTYLKKIRISYNCSEWSEQKDCVYNGNVSNLIYDKDFYYSCSTAGEVDKNTFKEENLISKLSKNSDMNFNLEVGENQIYVGADNLILNCKLKYRQKYIGV